MKPIGVALIKEMLEVLDKAGKKQVITLSKSELKLLIGVLKGYENLLNRLDGDYTEEIK